MTVTIEAYFAFAAIGLALVRYATYFYTIYKGETKPHAFSWLLWAVVTGIGAFGQYQVGGGPSVWALGFVASTCFFISILAYFIGVRDYTKGDWFALVFCLSAIPVWLITKDAILTLLIIILIDSLTYYPTFRKSYKAPDTEPPISYFFAGMRYFLMLFAVPNPSWETLIYPFFLMATDWGFVLFLVIRRAQLGLPLHEYAKPKTAQQPPPPHEPLI